MAVMRLEHAIEQFAGREEMLLANKLLKCFRTHARGQGPSATAVSLVNLPE